MGGKSAIDGLGIQPILNFQGDTKVRRHALCSEKKATDTDKGSSARASGRSTGQKGCSTTGGFFEDMTPVTAGFTQHPSRGEEILRKSLSV